VKAEYKAVIAPSGDILYVNEPSLTLVDTKLEDVAGKPLWEGPWYSWTPGAPETVKNMFEMVRGTGKQARIDITLKMPTGIHIYDYSLRPVKNDNGDVVSIIPEIDQKDNALSTREKEVLAWTAKGKTAVETGSILGISKRTVEFHNNHTRTKLSAANITHAIFIAVRCGVIGVAGTGICNIGIAAAMQSPLLRKLMLDIDVFTVAVRTVIS
jgi:DNA-binding CsgD family transcriptional regulator